MTTSPPSREDGGGVDLSELSAVDRPVILLWQVGWNLGGQTTIRRCGTNAMHPFETPGEPGSERCVCSLARSCWCMQVKVSFEVAALDVSVSLAVALDGGATVLPTSMAVDLLPEVHHPVAGHRRVVLRQRAHTWQPQGRLCHERRTRR
jgi:hypothetical protein